MTDEVEMTLEERVARLERTFMQLGSHNTIRELRNDIGKLFGMVQSMNKEGDPR